ncbi:MAG TPA: hypothetical protein ENI55_04155 [Alphaproteobacteria bacterium]|nr:hypothetical protein [Alphaproteobacteria bacterium]
MTAAAIIFGFALPAAASEVEIVAAKATKDSGGEYSFSVTLRHADSGWKHYADQWRVLAPDGTVLGTRVLFHPHVDEQPFTRGLSGVKVPAAIKRVLIQARDSVSGVSAKTFPVNLPGR